MRGIPADAHLEFQRVVCSKGGWEESWPSSLLHKTAMTQNTKTHLCKVKGDPKQRFILLTTENSTPIHTSIMSEEQLDEELRSIGWSEVEIASLKQSAIDI